MKSFEEWYLEQPVVSKKPINQELIVRNEGIPNTNHWVFPCCVCEEDSFIYCDPEDFDPDNHYCGRSQHCLP